MSFQDLSKFRLPENFRGRSAVFVQFWWLVQATFFRLSPQFAYGFRASILRLFGCSIGQNVLIRPTATITYPWKLTIGDNSWIGDNVELYCLGPISIGSNSVISQRSYICAGDHDYKASQFPIRSSSVNIGNECWIATDTFVAPGVVIGDGCVVGARSSVFTSLPHGMVCYGSPCKPIHARDTKPLKK